MSDKERDSFWDIEKLLPKKNTALSAFYTKERVVDVTVDGESERADAGRYLLSELHGDGDTPEERVYTPSSGLLKKITVRQIPDKFDFHANFTKAALLYYDFKASPCEFVPYYSYMPQYAQLTHAQKNYYFYWRAMVRQKKYIRTDYSYFYLYVYEIINLPQKISPKDGIHMMSDIWIAYRKELPNIDANMALWIQDYCMIYNIECPMDGLRDFVFSALGSSGFTEFYLSAPQTLGDSGISSVVSYLSDYDWRSGRYAGGDNREAYSRHMIGAMRAVISRLLNDGRILNSSSALAKMERTAFRTALTTSAAKYRIVAEYCPISSEPELRSLITSSVKYTENKLRAMLGVKSRLTAGALAEEYRILIDSYFSVLFAKVNRDRAREARPEYEKLYEADNTRISSESADEIERASWSTTARLVTEETEDEENYCEQPSVSNTPSTEAEPECAHDTLGAGHIGFLRAALDGDSVKMQEMASSMGTLCEAVADEINESFLDYIGDVVLVFDGDGYSVVEDYREDIIEWLSEQMK